MSTIHQRAVGIAADVSRAKMLETIELEGQRLRRQLAGTPSIEGYTAGARVGTLLEELHRAAQDAALALLTDAERQRASGSSSVKASSLIIDRAADLDRDLEGARAELEAFRRQIGEAVASAASAAEVTA